MKTIALLIAAFTLAGHPSASAGPKPNVLFIAVDDLRPQLGCYGMDWMKTPHMDALAARGTRFDRHYARFAVCIPSRVALLTSLRSERTHQVYGPHVWQNVPDGRSFAPLLANPAQPWKQAAYHVFDRPSQAKGKKGKKGEPVIGYGVRTENARYVEWHQGWSLDGRRVAREFYRYSAAQPDVVINEAEDPGLKALVAEHARLLRGT